MQHWQQCAARSIWWTVLKHVILETNPTLFYHCYLFSVSYIFQAQMTPTSRSHSARTSSWHQSRRERWTRCGTRNVSCKFHWFLHECFFFFLHIPRFKKKKSCETVLNDLYIATSTCLYWTVELGLTLCVTRAQQSGGGAIDHGIFIVEMPLECIIEVLDCQLPVHPRL